MIQIQSSWFPLSDRNPQKFTNIYTCGDSDFQKATIRIFHDRHDASAIILPVISGKPELGILLATVNILPESARRYLI